MNDYLSVDEVMTNNVIVTLGLSAISILSVLAANSMFKIGKADGVEINKNFIEQMRNGKIDIPQIAEKYAGKITVSQEFIDQIRSGQVDLTDKDKEMLAPIVRFDEPQQQTVQQPMVQSQIINQTQPVHTQPQYVNVQQPIPQQQAQTIIQMPQQPIINGQVSPVPTM